MTHSKEVKQNWEHFLKNILIILPLCHIYFKNQFPKIKKKKV